jgi:membrane carboxypeptidase/penicillin-binding protein PbpC
MFADRWAQEPEWDNITFGLNIIVWVGENAGKNVVNLSGFAIAVVYLLLVIGIFETVDRVKKVKEKKH